MNKKFTKNILKFLLLLFIALSSSCGQSTINEPIESIDMKGVLIYSDEQKIFSLNVQSQEITVLSGEYFPHEVIANSQAVYFSSFNNNTGNFDIFSVNHNGDEIRKLISERNISGIAISPNGKYLVYTQAGRDATNSIIVFDLELKKTLAFVDAGENEYFCPTWSPNTDFLLVFRITEDFSSSNLIQFTLKDYSIKEIYPELLFRTCSLSWLPNKEEVALSVIGKQVTNIQIFNLKTGHLKKLENFDTPIFNFLWSPNRNMFLSESSTFEEKITRIKILNADTGKETIIFEKEWVHWNYHPVWSPDGNYVAFFELENYDAGPLKLNFYDVNTGNSFGINIKGGWIHNAIWIYK